MSADQPREDKRQKYTPFGLQANAIGKLFENPDKPVSLPEPSKEKTIKPPPDIVKNVSSSTAGAGSGEFHVYKQARQREYERLSIMAERAEKETVQAEFAAKQEQVRAEDERKTSKNRARREKKKAAQQRAKETETEPSKKRRLVAPDAPTLRTDTPHHP
ncbi:uncharacterized protein MJAP1_002516 [Malassezia japonica]|uniref:DUF1168-domain-containing protein n=1 Tax=Malassezia japonica TaxID=223818 RepID=A0AAF0JA85_9BASI|nr:uncharacterized protein MJAP1_002516 [Malassezia japonica]WFD39537.1 hypothetical protein MJAP1_002516 [Malassezia japonica]